MICKFTTYIILSNSSYKIYNGLLKPRSQPVLRASKCGLRVVYGQFFVKNLRGTQGHLAHFLCRRPHVNTYGDCWTCTTTNSAISWQNLRTQGVRRLTVQYKTHEAGKETALVPCLQCTLPASRLYSPLTNVIQRKSHGCHISWLQDRSKK